MKTDLRILIADDHPIFRQGLKHVIEREPHFVLVGEAADGDAALQLIEECAPQIVVLDIDMPGRDGFAVARAVREKRLPVETIFLTMHKDEAHFNDAMNLGVKGFVIKETAGADLVDCIKAVASGQNYISPSLSTYLLSRSGRALALENAQPSFSELTATERHILRLLAEYKTSKEIARELGVSPHTIVNHRANICTKLNLQGTHALVKFATQYKDEISSAARH